MNNSLNIHDHLIENFELLDYDKAKIEILVSSETEKRIRTNSCKREPQTVDWIEQLPNGSVIFDVGANVGCYSLIAGNLNRMKKKVMVFAFEPHFVNFQQLVKNIRRNQLEEFIVPVNLAIGDRSENARLFHWDQYPLGEAGSSGHQLNQAIDYKGTEFTPSGMQSILSISLDDFSRVFGIVPTALKIDVDGIEELIIRGTGNILAQETCLRSILIEINGESSKFIHSYLLSLGFNATVHSKNGNVLFSRDNIE